MFCPQAEHIFEFLDGVPKLGTRVVGVREKILMLKVLTADNVGPKALVLGVEPPDPFDHQTNVHEFHVHNAQAFEDSGFTHRLPAYPMVLASGSVSLPVETRAVLIHGPMGTIS